MRQRRGTVIAATVVAVLLPASSAFAYIDPGTGSYMLQLFIGGMMAAGVLVKMYWNRIKTFFSHRGSGPSGDDE